jgi:hypothetical protein
MSEHRPYKGMVTLSHAVMWQLLFNKPHPTKLAAPVLALNCADPPAKGYLPATPARHVLLPELRGAAELAVACVWRRAGAALDLQTQKAVLTRILVMQPESLEDLQSKLAAIEAMVRPGTTQHAS